MKWYAIQRADGRYYSDQKELVETVGPQWVPHASAAGLYWGHKGEPIVDELRRQGMTVELVPVEVTVRRRSASKGEPVKKATRGHECASCGGTKVVGGRCQTCGSDMVRPV